MATTPEVLTRVRQRSGVSYPVLIPNTKGLENLLQIHGSSSAPIVDEIAIFTAASDSFNQANTNKTVQESLRELEKVVSLAKENGLRIRGYVSTVITCPFEGPIEPKRVRQVGKELLDMGCYEVSLGDTVGTGTETTVKALMEEVGRSLPMNRLAVGHGLTPCTKQELIPCFCALPGACTPAHASQRE